MDTLSTAKRSWLMRQVKSKNTKPEQIVRQLLWEAGFRYRLNVKSLPGTPDIANKKLKKVILIHGCFWHKHENCKMARMPKSRIDYWENKIAKNVERDKRNQYDLEKLGFSVLIVWECETKPKTIDSLKSKLIEFIKS